MADNYTHCAHIIDNLTEAEAEWLKVRINNDEWWEKNDSENEQQMFEASVNVDEFHFTDSGGHIDSEQIVWFVRLFLNTWRRNEQEVISFAHICSSPRPGEFGGHCVLVTAFEEHWFNPESMAEQFRAQGECEPNSYNYATNIDRMKESMASDPEPGPVPDGFEDALGSFGVVIKDGWCGEPVAWGYPITRHLGARFDELRKVAAVECVTAGEWVVVTTRLTPDMARARYGEVTELELGPRGGFKSVTYGDKKFLQRSLRPDDA